MFDLDLPIGPNSVLRQVESSVIAAVAIFAMWGCFFLPVQALEPADRPTRLARAGALWTGSGLAALWFLYALSENFYSSGETGWRISLTLATLLTSGVALCLALLCLGQTRGMRGSESTMQIVRRALPPLRNAVRQAQPSESMCQLRPADRDRRPRAPLRVRLPAGESDRKHLPGVRTSIRGADSLRNGGRVNPYAPRSSRSARSQFSCSLPPWPEA